MSLERSIEIIAEAAQVMARNGNYGNAAVQEIIRERDQARKDLADATCRRDYWSSRCSDQARESDKLRRTIIGLRGAMARWRPKKVAKV